LLALCSFFAVEAQVINFPDANFKAKLLQASTSSDIAWDLNNNRIKIDANNNGEIEVSEASVVSRLLITTGISTFNINSLEGIRFFTNLTNFQYNNNYGLISNLSLQGMTNLQNVLLFENNITNVDLSGCTNLQALEIRDNYTTGLNVDGCYNATSIVVSGSEVPAIDVHDFVNLQSLIIRGLNSINVRGCRNLSHLQIGGLFTDLNLNDCTNINTLQIWGSNLTSLNLENCSRLNSLLCTSSSSLKYLNIKNGVNEASINISLNPNLKFICADESQFGNIQYEISRNNYTNCFVSSYCSFVPGGVHFIMEGVSKFDFNVNGCDLIDPKLPLVKFNITGPSGTGAVISDDSGSYKLSVIAGTHTITPVFEVPNYFIMSPQSKTVSFPTEPSPSFQDFCVTANGLHPDLEIIQLPIRSARPGSDAVYKLIYKNKGTNTQSGTLNLSFNDAVLDFVSATPTVNNQTANNLSWDFTNLLPFETREISLTLNVNSPMETPAVNGGDVLNYTASITSAATDETPDDNSFTLNQTVVNSYDPNDKTCLEGATISPSEVGKYVHYMIRFENTGTFPAENIVVKDMIDTNKLDINSLVPIKGSHDFFTRINGNKVEFIFENINLPFDDANNDGYVAFKIKTKPTLVVGNTFSNSASIYFDYNFPIVTNTATTAIQTLSTQDFEFGQYLSLYPNPVNNELNIETKQTIEVSSISIYNTLGQLVVVVPNAKNITKIDVSSLSSGNYFVKINSDKGTANTKFIKN